jgi:hypothetical protein
LQKGISGKKKRTNMRGKYKSKQVIIPLVMVIFAFSSLVSGSEMSKYISKEPLWKNKKEVKLEHVLTIGSDDFEEDEKYFFALIIDIKFDRYGNLYVLDSKTWRINKYSPKGIFMQSFKLSKGRGPGDYVRPKKIAIDKEDDIFIVDMYKRITILDKLGELKSTLNIKEKGFLAYIEVGFDKSIYLTKYHNSNIDRIFQYSPITGKLIKTFCKGNRDKILRRAVSGSVVFDSDGNLYYTAFYPYAIKKFSKDGRLLKHFSRDANFQDPIKSTIDSFGMEFLSMSMGIAVFPDGKTLNLIRHQTIQNKNRRKTEYWFDVFSKDGKWLTTFSSDRLKNDFVRFYNIDPYGYLYLDYSTPYPHIKKYKIEFVDKK